MGDPTRTSDPWDTTWEGARRHLLESTLAATPAERLAWLEEALELAREAGALRSSLDEPLPDRGL
jgi:hypothetical protein